MSFVVHCPGGWMERGFCVARGSGDPGVGQEGNPGLWFFILNFLTCTLRSPAKPGNWCVLLWTLCDSRLGCARMTLSQRESHVRSWLYNFQNKYSTCHCPGCTELREGHCCLCSRLGWKLSATKEPFYPSGLPNATLAFWVVLPNCVAEGNISEINRFLPSCHRLPGDIVLPSCLRASACFQSPHTWEVLTLVIKLHQHWPSKVGCLVGN